MVPKDIDHIFIFSNNQGQVADELVEFGLTEGSNRVHVGQGTSNRKFYFNNFFLEILWVHNEAELHSVQTKPSGLWKRADFEHNQFAPFGLCLVNVPETEPLFEKSFRYQPDYFPDRTRCRALVRRHVSTRIRILLLAAARACAPA